MTEANTPQEQTKETPEKLDPMVVNEGLAPELSDEYFLFEGQKIQIKPLKIKYQMQLAKLVQPVAYGIGLDIGDQRQWFEIIANALHHYDVLPKLVQILVLNDDKECSDDQIENSTMQPEDMIAVAMKFVRKNQTIGKPIADFFTETWPRIERQLTKFMVKAKEEAVKNLEAMEKADQKTKKPFTSTT